MRSLGISATTLLLTGAVVGNAYMQKKQFYPSVVYITKSNASMAVIYIQSLLLVLMMGKLMRKIFLGTLRAAEFEHLMERFWYALTETCLAFTVFRDDFNPKFVALFTVLLFLKSFHWLAEDRVDYMERSPVIGWLFHVRVSALLSVLGLLDYILIVHAYNATLAKGATVQLVFGFEYAILMTMVANIAIKYALHAAELRADTPWENKAVFLLYTELVIGFVRVSLYVVFVVIMVHISTLPLFAFRPMYFTMRNFKKALNDVIQSRRAIRNMNTLYPDATPEELTLSDNICIICREDMINTSKKLPCGHIFHTACLRSWFQRQQTCPTCRLNILRTPTVVPTPRNVAVVAAAAAGGAAAIPPTDSAANGGTAATNATQAEANANGQNVLNNNIPGPNPFAGFNANFFQFGQNNPFMNLMQPGQAPIPMPATTSSTTTTPPNMPQFIPAFPFPPPPSILPPRMPLALDTLTDEEIRALEGNERKHVEERIKLLRNVQTLMDASVTLMNQYVTITARLPPLNVKQTDKTKSSAKTTSPTNGDGQSKVITPTTTTTTASPSSEASETGTIVVTTTASDVEKPKDSVIINESVIKSSTTTITTTTTTKSSSPSSTPSTSSIVTVFGQQNNSNISNIKLEDTVTIEDLGSDENDDSLRSHLNDSNSSTDSSTMEIRRRRLEKFQHDKK